MGYESEVVDDRYQRVADRLVCLAIALTAFALVATRYQALYTTWDLNRVALVTVGAFLHQESSDADLTLARLGLRNCRAYWLRAIIMDDETEPYRREQGFAEAIRCSPAYVELAWNVLPASRALAKLAVAQHPTEAAAWLWLAQLHAEAEPARAIQLYRQGLSLNPYDAISWRLLGDLLVDRSPAEAIVAYLQSCRYGDPGYHGCLRAGRTAEQMNDIPAAIQYYRYSRFPPARERADELERAHIP
jgi:tetratricopeptide (TPR) repeat protein